MRRFFVISLLVALSSSALYGNGVKKNKKKKKDVKEQTVLVKHIDSETFRAEIFDYKKHKYWRYKGKKPLLIDFYANWCLPCRRVAPILVQLQAEYGHKLQIYKVNITKEKELQHIFRITAIPSFLFVPVNDIPRLSKGALSREVFIESIEDILKVKHPLANAKTTHLKK